ncbi:uncharacterized protein VP01_2653g6 [Puccinia sorghi]|uniref:C2H2-type domain-containing protein n=1 Tax=Puccinia sorghi TaxID=27349 RepID=A0A0L6V4U8_9BASI|nr:uncharacterized protein VP01_2653g6 [Puccinia sorghi]
MDCFSSQPSLKDLYPEDPQNQGQFDWNPLATDPSLNVHHDASGSTLPENFFDPVFTPGELASLMQTCTDSLGPQDLFSTANFAAGNPFNLSEWSLPPFPELSFPSAENPFIQPSIQPSTIVSDPTIYRDGFGNPIVPVEYRPFDSPASHDTYSSPPPMPSSGYSPSEAYPQYSTYSLPQPSPPEMERPNPWHLIPSSTYSPTKAIARSDVTSPSGASEPRVKKHRCQICGRAFQRQTTLTQHQSTYSHWRKALLLPCSKSIILFLLLLLKTQSAGCDKAFTTASNAKRHAKTHFRIAHGYHHVAHSARPY